MGSSSLVLSPMLGPGEFKSSPTALVAVGLIPSTDCDGDWWGDSETDREDVGPILTGRIMFSETFKCLLVSWRQ